MAPTPPYRIGIVFDLLGTAPAGVQDADAEYEPPETVEALAAAVRAAGHEPVEVGNPHALLRAIASGTLPRLDLVWNIAEGHGARNREAWAPVLLEMAGIPCLGADALSQSLSLDKAWTLDLVAAAGVATAGHRSVPDPEALVRDPFFRAFPLFVKPRWEGTAKGIGPHSRVENPEALRAAVARIVRDYDQPALVEPFLPGAEYTVTIVGHAPPEALPVQQRALEAASGIGLHAVGGDRWTTPGILDDGLTRALRAEAVRAFEVLRCRDFARVDFKCASDGAPCFLEINPLPTFAPDGSFAILAELAGRPYDEFLADVLRRALAARGLDG